jgi:Flp pilus assembly protein TadD/TolB-like protein
VPFENQSKAPGIEWISDSFPELIQERIDSPTLYVLTREDRIRAYDRFGIPLELHPSRATIYRIAEQLDVDFVLLGSYSFDGRTFATRAQLLDMRHEHLLPLSTESGTLPELINVETSLAWDVVHSLRPALSVSRAAYMESAAPIRLDAFENYIRGVVAATDTEQIQHFREAVRLDADYPEAELRLGEAYYRDRQYEAAIASLARVPQGHPKAREANFYLGLAAYAAGDAARAEAAFEFVAARLPLAEVYNNLGVVTARRDKKSAADYFRKAVETDPSDPDYQFNLALELYREGDLSGATKHLRETASLRPGDADAKMLLDTIAAQTNPPAARSVVPASFKMPVERIRATYDESSFRQLALGIEAAAEQRLAKSDLRTHAQFHADRGHEFLRQGFVSEAEREFREAIALNVANADAHSGLAAVLEANNDEAGARLEAEMALRLRQFPEPLLVLARLDMRDNKTEMASADVDRALKLDPSNNAALALKRAVAAKLAQEAQPLPNR